MQVGSLEQLASFLALCGMLVLDVHIRAGQGIMEANTFHEYLGLLELVNGLEVCSLLQLLRDLLGMCSVLALAEHKPELVELRVVVVFLLVFVIIPIQGLVLFAQMPYSIQCCINAREIPNSLPMPLQDGTSCVPVLFGSDCSRVGGLDAHLEVLGEFQSIFSKCLVVLEHCEKPHVRTSCDAVVTIMSHVCICAPRRHVRTSLGEYIYIYINIKR